MKYAKLHHYKGKKMSFSIFFSMVKECCFWNLQLNCFPKKFVKLWELFYCTVKPLIKNTSKEFSKCRILHFPIMKCCRYLELFKTVPAYSWLFIYFRKYSNLRNIV